MAVISYRLLRFTSNPMGGTDDRIRYFQSFADLTYEDFQVRAADSSLSANEKIGFPREYRDGLTEVILSDIAAAIPAVNEAGALVLDIGCGCGDLAKTLINLATRNQLMLLMCDSEEMLNALPQPDTYQRVTGRFPDECSGQLGRYEGALDGIIVYSVLQYVVGGSSLIGFLTSCTRLLKPGGRCLLGDIPNQSMRNRFFASEAGIKSHQEFVADDELPMIPQFTPLDGTIDDSIVLFILQYVRSIGCHAYVVPQDVRLPASNRREDIIIARP